LISSPTLALLRERLGDSRLPDDPTHVVLPPGSEHWPDDFRARLSVPLRPAGVLIPVIERDGGLVVLLTRRSAELRVHASQIAFPGGRMEPGDRTIEETALREAHEEVGIAPEQVAVLGYLDAMPTVTGYAVTPVVGAVSPAAVIAVDPSEVELAFEVPLDFLLDKANARAAERDVGGRRLPIIEYRYREYRIWGATAHMLVKLREKLEKS
jgi:8-oxo-dGTP pyrophosphatase MutT (NUDIX family)